MPLNSLYSLQSDVPLNINCEKVAEKDKKVCLDENDDDEAEEKDICDIRVPEMSLLTIFIIIW